MNANPTHSFRPSAADLDRVMRQFGVNEAQARRDFVVSWMLWSISRSTPNLVFFGGTGVLIIVGVTLDTMRQVETYLLQRHYDGFLRRGKLRGRFERTAGGTGKVMSSSSLVWIYAGIGILVIAGMAAYLASGK